MSEFDRPGFVGMTQLMHELGVTYYLASKLVAQPGVERYAKPFSNRVQYRLDDVRRELDAAKEKIQK